jgi:peptidyl-prolyl cis-trans isomerase SurA
LEVGQIIKYPLFSDQARQAAIAKINGIRERIIAGEDFKTLAILYSQDPGSARAGGELGFVSRGDLVKDFEAVAFKIKQNEISKIIETEYGYHILQLIERRGEQVNVRHILIKPEYSNEDYESLKTEMDALYEQLKTDSISFSKAVEKYSDDVSTKNSGGMILNPSTGNTRIESNMIDAQTFQVVDTLAIGTYSSPTFYQSATGNYGYRIVYLKNKYEPHKANLKDDYQKLQEGALMNKQAEIIATWFKKRKKETYIKIEPGYSDCDILESWNKQ